MMDLSSTEGAEYFELELVRPPEHIKILAQHDRVAYENTYLAAGDFDRELVEKGEKDDICQTKLTLS